MRWQSRARIFTHTGVDGAAVYAVADQMGAAAALIDDAVGQHLGRIAFSGAGAGRAHTARGDALRARLDRLAAELAQWSRSTVEITVVLRAGADPYAGRARDEVGR